MLVITLKIRMSRGMPAYLIAGNSSGTGKMLDKQYGVQYTLRILAPESKSVESKDLSDWVDRSLLHPRRRRKVRPDESSGQNWGAQQAVTTSTGASCTPPASERAKKMKLIARIYKTVHPVVGGRQEDKHSEKHVAGPPGEHQLTELVRVSFV